MDVRRPRAGHHYPRSTGESQSWFATDADRLDHLEWLRWPDGPHLPTLRARRSSARSRRCGSGTTAGPGTARGERLVTRLQADADAAGELDWLVSVDSTVVRAHQHAAGARRQHLAEPADAVDAAEPAAQEQVRTVPALTGGDIE